LTTGYGDCLYNAISLELCGNESLAYKIKLAMVFMAFEYESYFHRIYESFKYQGGLTYEAMIAKSASIGEWGCEFNFLMLSVLFLRPLWVYSDMASHVANVTDSTNAPIYIALCNAHFSPIVPINLDSEIAVPTSEHLNFRESRISLIKYY
jgi:hypothetical protein